MNKVYAHDSSIPSPGIQVPSRACRFFPAMIDFIDSIRHSFIIGFQTLATGSGICPTSSSFVTLRLVFFFSLSRNRTLQALVLCWLSSSMVRVCLVLLSLF